MPSLKLFVVALVFMILLCSPALATVPAGLVDDFAPVEALVLMARDGEVLIDAAAPKGVRSGDLFSVVGASEEVVHPQTGAVVGTHRRTAGLLQVVQVRPGFSIARQLSGAPPAAGSQVLRYEQVAARFLDLSAQGEALAAELRAALPQLDWAGYERLDRAAFEALRAKGVDSAGLLFVLEGERLDVRSADFELLRSYDQVRLQAVAPTLAPAAVAVPAVAAAGAIAATTTTVTGGTQIEPLKAVWSGLPAKKLPVGLVVADLDGDGRQEIARAFVDRVEIGRLVGEDYTQLQVVEFPGEHKGLALAALDANGNGTPELYVTIAARRGLSSQVLEFRDGQYRVVAAQLNWFLAVTTLPGEGAVLLAQEHDGSYTGFSPQAFRLTWQGGALQPGTLLSLPKRGTIFSINALSGAGSSQLVRMNGDGRLEVTDPSGEPLWVSGESGNTETGYTQPDPNTPGGVDELSNDIFLPPVLLVPEDQSVLTLMGQGSTLTGLFRQITSCDVAAWHWDGIEMKKTWSQTIDGYVPAAVLADSNNDGRTELAVLLAFPSNNPFSSRKSVLRLYEIRE